MNIRPLADGDGPAMQAFMETLPVGETAFFRGEAITAARISEWARQDNPLHFVAVDEGGLIAGYVAVIPRSGMSSHVGEISLVVAPAHRGKGIGKALAKAAMIAAFRGCGLEKLVVEIVARQDRTAAMFQNIGFAPEALLIDHLRDEAGEKYDLLVLCHHVASGWADMITLGLDDALGRT